jgi:protein-disulfide isomerase
MVTGETVALKNPVAENDHVSGPSDAPVTLVEYGNFECIHCGSAYPIIKEARKLLGASLRFVFRHFPTVRTHPHSLRAAEASECAAAQEKFWDMHDELFIHQHALDDNHLARYAKRISLDMDRFEREMKENAFLKKIEAEYQRSLFDEHVTGTPTFYINGTRYTGATDLPTLLAAFKAADPEERIDIPRSGRGLSGLLKRLRPPTHE